MMWTFKVIFAFIWVIFPDICLGSFVDTTSGIFGKTKDGLLAAFGDFNADKAIDVFVLSVDGKSVQLVLGTTEKIDASYSQQELISESWSNGTYMLNIVPGDFNGDSMMDVLVTRRKDGDTTGPFQLVIFWGDILKNKLDPQPFIIEESFRDQPAIVDVNADMIPDLMGEHVDGTDTVRKYWIFNQDNNYTTEVVKNETSSAPLPSLQIPQSSAFLDFNMDLTADIITVSIENNLVQFEVWLNKDGELLWHQTIVAPKTFAKVGQPSFVDMNNDHSVDIVLPCCEDDDCVNSVVYVWSNKKWYKLDVVFSNGESEWRFQPSSMIPYINIPISLKMGDMNLDGYPDALSVLTKTVGENVTQQAFILKNMACSSCEGFSRKFVIQFSSPLSSPSLSSLLVAFFDIGENGILDVVLSNYDSDSKRSKLQALSQMFTEDAYFIKIMVLSGLCKEDCPQSHARYGVNQPGPTIKYQTVNSNGDQQIGIASQLTQAAYFSLQLPFTVFGLGQTPNFVDTLEVGIPYPKGKSPRHKEFTSIIPNSRLVITPYELDSPNSWNNKLFITPSRLVLLTGASLMGTCTFIAVIVAILHWRDRAEDKREKLQDSHKFHFDAM